MKSGNDREKKSDAGPKKVVFKREFWPEDFEMDAFKPKRKMVYIQAPDGTEKRRLIRAWLRFRNCLNK